MAAKKSISLKLFEGSIKEFIEQIGIGEKNSVYLKKQKGYTLKKLWWEDKDKWFCNWGECKTTDTNTTDVPWIISKDIEHRINFYVMQENLSMYIIEKK
ncbi:hypothetical protein M0Q50_03050 [bacterium]|jgi:hypothetical protein|nr:hypothetical protein [bacterium]